PRRDGVCTQALRLTYLPYLFHSRHYSGKSPNLRAARSPSTTVLREYLQNAWVDSNGSERYFHVSKRRFYPALRRWKVRVLLTEVRGHRPRSLSPDDWPHALQPLCPGVRAIHQLPQTGQRDEEAALNWHTIP